MKRVLNSIRSFAIPITTLLFAAVLFTACKKDDPTDNVHVPVAGLMAFNLAPDKDAVGLSLSGSNLNLGSNGLAYNSFSGAYLPVYTGSREVRSFDYVSGSTIALSNESFADSGYYSAFVLGTNGNYRNVVVRDQLDSLTAVDGKTWVRYINAIAGSSAAPTVSITAGSENSVNETAAYATVSAFKQVNAGSVNIGVTNGGTISASRSITLEQNKAYTVLLTGIPGATDTAKAVQVKFILNGNITP